MAVDSEEERKGGEDGKELHGDVMFRSADEKLWEDACDDRDATEMRRFQIAFSFWFWFLKLLSVEILLGRMTGLRGDCISMIPSLCKYR
jgi:hypothetical protein